MLLVACDPLQSNQVKRFAQESRFGFVVDVTKTRNGDWGMGNGEWGMGNGEWGMGNGEWEIEKWENKKNLKIGKRHEIDILYK